MPDLHLAGCGHCGATVELWHGLFAPHGDCPGGGGTPPAPAPGAPGEPMPAAVAEWIRRVAAPGPWQWGHPGHVTYSGACDSTPGGPIGTTVDVCSPCTGPYGSHRCWHGEPVPEGTFRGRRGWWDDWAPALWLADRICRVRCACQQCHPTDSPAGAWLAAERHGRYEQPSLFGGA